MLPAREAADAVGDALQLCCRRLLLLRIQFRPRRRTVGRHGVPHGRLDLHRRSVLLLGLLLLLRGGDQIARRLAFSDLTADDDRFLLLDLRARARRPVVAVHQRLVDSAGHFLGGGAGRELAVERRRQTAKRMDAAERAFRRGER